jgi:3-oxoadipate enol-lactonase
MDLLHHEATGGGDLALLLIHALGADLHMWNEFRGLWGERTAIIACDLRSAGQSPRPDCPIAPAGHVVDLERLRRHVGFKRVVPIGCAVGAMTAAAYAAEHPERTAALVLSNPALATSPQAGAVLADRAQQVRHSGMAAILPGAVDRAFVEQPRDKRYDTYLRRFAEQDAEAYALACLGTLKADASGDLRRIRCPTLVVAGGHDVLLPSEQSRAVHALVREACFALVEDGAHFVPYQRPEAFVRLVQSFLAESDLIRPEAARSVET